MIDKIVKWLLELTCNHDYIQYKQPAADNKTTFILECKKCGHTKIYTI